MLQLLHKYLPPLNVTTWKWNEFLWLLLCHLQGKTNSRHLWLAEVFMMFRRPEYQNYWIARGCWEMESCSANTFFFRAKHFESPVLVDQAHWLLAPKPVTSAQPRPFMVRFHYYYTRECIFRLAVSSQLQWGEKFNFHNLRETVRTQHIEFDMVWQRCRKAGMAFFPSTFSNHSEWDQTDFWEMYCLSLFFIKWKNEHYQVATVKDRITQNSPC